MNNDKIKSYADYMHKQELSEARYASSNPIAAKREIEIEYAKAQRSIDAYKTARTSNLEKQKLADALSSMNQTNLFAE
jgi:hypothetical protein